MRSPRAHGEGREASVKAVFFDFDGVLTTDKTGSLTTLRYLSRHTGIAYEDLRDAFQPYNRDLNLGKITHEEIWPDLCAALSRQIEISLLRNAFESTPMNREMLGLARRLRQRYFVGIITDNKKDRLDHLKRHLGLTALFDPIVVSAEIGSSKDTTTIFQSAVDYLDIGPAESVFIDNARENLAAANALGIATVYFDDESSDVQALCETLRKTCGMFIPSAAWRD